MRKSIIVIAAMLAFAASANAQWFDFKNNVHRYEIGVNLGQAGNNASFHDFGVGASFSAWGVYIDFIGAGPVYRHDNRVASMNDPANLRYLPDSTVTVVNLGYQIPVLPWLRLMPIVGMCFNSDGYTDMATQNAETSSSGETVMVDLTHDYKAEHRYNEFNFGGGLVISPIKYFSVYGVYTTHAIYGGISLNLSAMAKDND